MDRFRRNAEHAAPQAASGKITGAWKTGRGRALAAGLALLVSISQHGYAAAQTLPTSDRSVTRAHTTPHNIAASVLNLDVGTGRVIALGRPAANIFVADPKVAEVRPASATSMFVFGVTAGRTTIAALDHKGHSLVEYDVVVHTQAFGAQEAQSLIAQFLPDSHIRVLPSAKGLILSGSADSAESAARAVAIAKGFASGSQDVDNELKIRSSVQVTLNVRIAEMSRTVIRNLGVNWSSIGVIGRIGMLPALTLNANNNTISCGGGGGSITLCPGGNFNGVIDALAQDNLAHVLAEPNLTVRSGQPASFQVGGEYPIPVSEQNGAISVSYKNYGIMLDFLPTVMSDGRIDVHVKPEVSQLDKTNGVTVNGGTAVLTIPAITVRRAETSVELGSGESFAIAGLLQQTTQDNASGVPGLGDTPVLGALFRDTAFQKGETELVIIVTPYIVQPVVNAAALRLPTDGYRSPPDIERLLLMRQVADRPAPVPVRIPGNAGFSVE
ncbi:MAG TPA: type II and III secretion system protein family protein [Rhodopila sp.]|nr:type II and III secretion system protein family protein [Rhodopila sp.]